MPTESPFFWSDKHNVQAYLVPFDYLTHDPWELLIACRELFDSMPTYAQTWDWSDIEAVETTTSPERQAFYGAILGSFRIQNTNTADKYLNPNYCHDKHESPRDVWNYIEVCANTGVRSVEGVADDIGVNPWVVRDRAAKMDITWTEQRSRGLEKVANTIRLAQAWADHTHDDFATALGVSTATTERWVSEVATIEDIPDHPKDSWRRYHS